MFAQVGALTFRLAATAAARLAEFEAQPVGCSADGTLLRVADGGDTYLLLDHRRDSTNPAARVEFWEPCDAGEASVCGLLALGDLCGRTLPESEPVCLPAFARRLREPSSRLGLPAS